MSTIDEMLKSFASMAEQQDFIKQQHLTILELTKKVDKLNAKIKQLEENPNSPALVQQNSPSIVNATNLNDAYEENICKMEIKKLHDISLERQLTYEETKKVDILTKLLLAINQKPKGQIIDAKKRDTSELLKLVSNSEDEQGNS